MHDEGDEDNEHVDDKNFTHSTVHTSAKLVESTRHIIGSCCHTGTFRRLLSQQQLQACRTGPIEDKEIRVGKT